MKRAGQIVLTPFPYSDLTGAKLRPVLMLRQASKFDDWLVCMVSSQVQQNDGKTPTASDSGNLKQAQK
jgi:mRNA interferase MazF